MLRFLRESLIIFSLTGLGAAFSLLNGLAPRPWLQPELAAGEIRGGDAGVLDPLWVDARSQTDYDAAHIPQAILLNEDNWDDQINDLIGAWLTDPRPIVVYCSSESCGNSKRVATRLREALPDAEIYSLKGGWEHGYSRL